MNEVALFGQNEEKWYTIEEIAELCGYEPNSLKYGEAKRAIDVADRVNLQDVPF